MFYLPDLPYDYTLLEPFIDTETMHIHHDKHHGAYVKNLNDALVGHDDLLNLEVNDLLQSLGKVPEPILQKVKNNAGGHANHNLFWTLMTPSSNSVIPTSGKLFDHMVSTFGGFEDFKTKFSSTALSHFGSGWAWLLVENGNLVITTTQNQDSPLSDFKKPILCLDVWEHAYYLKYKNVRADYINAWWNVVNWKEVEKLYDGIQ